MDCSTVGSSALHSLSEFAQIHLHWVGDGIQPSHSLSPSSPALNLSQYQDIFQQVGSSHQRAKVLELQHQSFQWIFRADFLYDWLVWSPWSPGDSQESSAAAQFESTDSSALSLLYGRPQPHRTTGKTTALTLRTFVGKVVALLFNTLSSFVIAFLPRNIFQFHGCSHRL